MTAGFEVPDRAQAAGTPSGNAFRQDSFVLESHGWSSPSLECAPKLAALASLANLEPPDPVAAVGYRSQGNLLIIAGASTERARRCALALAPDLHVTLVSTEFAPAPAITSWRGEVRSLTGYLGEFMAQVALDGAAKPAKFDLVLDFSAQPHFAMRQPPQGYHAAPSDDAALERVLDDLREAVGEFEKPRYFAYRENICAHSRSAITGCNRCIDICSTQAISADGDHVKVDPHLCMGCGACATVCPSGAMSYQFPRVADRGAQLKQLLSTYRNAGGTGACIVFHDGAARDALAEAASTGEGLPARALPLETWHVAAVGLDLLLPAVAFGASQVVVLASGDCDREYLDALRSQAAIGQAILSGLGYAGTHLHVIEARDGRSLEAAFRALEATRVPEIPATFMLGNDKRTAIEFAVEHLARHAPAPANEIALPAGSPFGEIHVDTAKCTMCMACVGACPESALMDGVDQPLLKFLERNCVQCGLCSATCPEGAIALSPRLLLTGEVRQARVVNRTEPFHCVSCGKAFGTKQIVQSMMGRLTGHSMFAGEGALRRLQMCADCRVVDMMSAKDEVSVMKLGNS